jgi:fused signal recognition particle receptor
MSKVFRFVYKIKKQQRILSLVCKGWTMGFFSKLKRLWTTDDSTKPAEQEAPESAIEAGAEELESTEPIAAEPAPQDLHVEEVQPEAAPVAEVPEPAVVPTSVEAEIVLEPEFIYKEAEPVVEVVEAVEPRVEPEVTAAPAPEVTPESTLEPEVIPEPTPEPVAPVAPVAHGAAPVSAPATAPIEPTQTETAKVITDDQPQWQKDLTVSLRGAEPKLSIWLELVLDGIEEVGDPLWDRLRFFEK